jgi:hypothetical protein
MDFNDLDLDKLVATLSILKDADVEEATVAGIHIKFRAPEAPDEASELPSTPTVTKRDVSPKNPYQELLGQQPPTWTSTQKAQ